MACFLFPSLEQISILSGVCVCVFRLPWGFVSQLGQCHAFCQRNYFLGLLNVASSGKSIMLTFAGIGSTTKVLGLKLQGCAQNRMRYQFGFGVTQLRTMQKTKVLWFFVLAVSWMTKNAAWVHHSLLQSWEKNLPCTYAMVLFKPLKWKIRYFLTWWDSTWPIEEKNTGIETLKALLDPAPRQHGLPAGSSWPPLLHCVWCLGIFGNWFSGCGIVPPVAWGNRYWWETAQVLGNWATRWLGLSKSHLSIYFLICISALKKFQQISMIWIIPTSYLACACTHHLEAWLGLKNAYNCTLICHQCRADKRTYMRSPAKLAELPRHDLDSFLRECIKPGTQRAFLHKAYFDGIFCGNPKMATDILACTDHVKYLTKVRFSACRCFGCRW